MLFRVRVRTPGQLGLGDEIEGVDAIYQLEKAKPQWCTIADDGALVLTTEEPCHAYLLDGGGLILSVEEIPRLKEREI